MGLRCLLGHNFGEPEVERDREEDGSEVVITVTEVKECRRCGERQVVSENKEVTSLDQLRAAAGTGNRAGGSAEPAEPAATDAPGVGGEASGVGGEPSGAGGEAPGVEGEGSTVDSEPGGDAAASPEEATAADADPAPVDGGGAEIIDDGPTEGAGGEPEPTVDLSEAAGDPTEPAPGTDGRSPGDADGRTPDDAESDVEGDGPSGTDAEFIEETTSAETGVDEAVDGDSVAEEVPGRSEPDPETDPETDDGVILDEEPEEAGTDRDPGEWPDVDADEEGPESHSPWPDRRGDDEGFDATVDDDPDGDVSYEGGLAPEAAETGDVDEDTEFIETPEDADGGFVATAEESVPDGSAAASPDAAAASDDAGRPEPDLAATATDSLSEYYCPECELAEVAGDSSMRAGDICPECKRGYIAERSAK